MKRIGLPRLGASLAAAALSTWALVAQPSKAPPPEPATLVLRGGRVYTLDPARPEARAIAIRRDRVAAVGSDADVKPFVGAGTEVIDVHGGLVTPGFVDAHAHFRGIGERKLGLDLTVARSWDEIVAMVAAAAKTAKPGDWIVGRGWHQEKWTAAPAPNVEGFPVHDSLSAASPVNPVLLTHASGHASFANAKAMELAGITKDSSNPAGGEILKEATGRPTGLLRETASGLVSRVREAERAKRSEAEIEAEELRILQLATEECLAKGLTGVHDAGVSFSSVERYARLSGEKRLGIRLYVMVRESPDQLAAGLASHRKVAGAGELLTVRAIKVTIDGALGSRGAWLLEPYSDQPSSTGLNTVPLDALRETAKLALANGYQLCVHAIGDRANREVLDVYEAAFRSKPEPTDLRWRVEHAQHLNRADIPRFGKLRVIASMQGIHCTSDAPFVTPRLGARRAAEGAYMWRSLMDSGAVICNGTDAPVEDVDPIPSFHASVTRRLKDGTAFYPGQKMSRAEALRSYTLNAAYASFQEKEKGSLAPGLLADVTVFSKDILAVPDDKILSAHVLYTIVDGQVKYRAGR